MFQKYMPEKKWLIKQVTIDDVKNDLFKYISDICHNKYHIEDKIDQNINELEATLQAGDELWYYHSGRNSFVSLSGRSGYCIMKNNEIVLNFQTVVS